MNQPLLSVIVPCYNVEKYIDKCISSIVNQTYTHLEIILIDDGSADSTGIMCDAWQERDQRIRVIHKENEGVSYARKTGVEHATAEYVTFVDPDDWIDKNMYTNMMTALLSTNSDIAQCGFCNVFENDSIQQDSSVKNNGAFEIIDRTKGVSLILEDKEWNSYMWNKIFKKQLFDHIEFPKGRIQGEDTSIAHFLFHHASQTVYLKDKYYFYFHRKDSVINSNIDCASKIKKMNDSYNANYDRYCFVQQHVEYQNCLNVVKNHVFSRGLRVLRYSIIYPHYSPKNYCHSLEKQLCMIGFARKDMLKVFFSPLMRIEFFVFQKSPVTYKRFILLYVKMIHFFTNKKCKSIDCRK